jgi:hypothetical protein
MNPLDRVFVFPALRGDWFPLALYILHGRELTPAMRLLLANVIMGKRDLKLRKPERRKNELVSDVLRLEHHGSITSNAVEAVSKTYQVNARTVWRALESERPAGEKREKILRDFRIERAKRAMSTEKTDKT